MPANLGVLVTRPKTLAASLVAKLAAKGVQVWQLPTLNIHMLTHTPQVQQAIAQLNHYTWHIFVSRHAVLAVMPQFLECQLDLSQLHFATVGPGTAEELAGFIKADIIYPQSGLGSAALLHTLENKLDATARVMIWCGDEATPILAQGLQARSIAVQSVVCYRREKSLMNVADINAALLMGKIQYVMVSSGVSLEHLVSVLNSDALNTCTFIVISERLRTLARTLGFQGEIILAKGADDASMLQAIQL